MIIGNKVSFQDYSSINHFLIGMIIVINAFEVKILSFIGLK